MICTSCRVQDHDKCEDKMHDRLYASCACLHRVPEKTDEETADPTDC